MKKIIVISRVDYVTILFYAEKIFNGQSEFVSALRRELRDKLNIDDAEPLLDYLRESMDPDFPNYVRSFLAQYPFVIKGDNGEYYQLAEIGNVSELNAVPQEDFVVDEKIGQKFDRKMKAAARFKNNYSVYTPKEYDSLDLEEVKFNHVNIVMHNGGKLAAIDGHFDCHRIETAYRRFCAIMESIDGKLYPGLDGWNFTHAEKITCFVDDNGVRSWLNEDGEFLFGDSRDMLPADNCLVVDYEENYYYFFGYFDLYPRSRPIGTPLILPEEDLLEDDKMNATNETTVEKEITAGKTDNNVETVEQSSSLEDAKMENTNEQTGFENDKKTRMENVFHSEKNMDAKMENVFEMESSTLQEELPIGEKLVMSTLEERAERIRQLQADVQRGIIAIGCELIEAKKQLNYGGWTDWLQKEFEWTQRTANNFMRVAERFGKLDNVVQFKPSTLQAMLALPEGDEEAFIEAQAEVGKPVAKQSAREVQAAVKQWKKDKEKKISPRELDEIDLFAEYEEVNGQIVPFKESDSAGKSDAIDEKEMSEPKTYGVIEKEILEDDKMNATNEKTLSSEAVKTDGGEMFSSSTTGKMDAIKMETTVGKEMAAVKVESVDEVEETQYEDEEPSEPASLENANTYSFLTTTTEEMITLPEEVKMREEVQTLLAEIDMLIKSATKKALADTIQTLKSIRNDLSCNV